MNENLLTRIKNRLKSDHYSMNNEWLRECVEYSVSQHENSSAEEILKFVRDQWHLSDLREINNENGCLPRNLSQQPFITLPEKYILQVEQMYDIATSKYKQLEQIRNIHISEEEISEAEKIEKYEPTKKRMMQLRLTDGLQDIIGIEYSYMPQLNDMLLPGCKVMILGPVKCRKGVLLLEKKNFKGIGGEVDSLLFHNAVENVLARALNLPENPNPYNDDETQPNNVKQEELKVDNLFEDDFEVNFNDLDLIEDSLKDNMSTKDTTKIKIENTNTAIKNVQHSAKGDILDDDDDCLLEMIDESQFVEKKVEQINVTSPYTTLPSEADDIIVINEDVPDTKADILKKPTLPSDRANSTTISFQSGINNKQQASLNLGKRNVPMSPPEVLTVKRGKMGKQTAESSKVLNFSEPKITKFLKPLNTPEDSKASILSNQPIINNFTQPSNTFRETKLTECTKALSSPRESEIIKFGEPFNVPQKTEKSTESQSVPGELEHCEFICTIKNSEFTETTYKTVRARVQHLGKLGKKDSLWSLDGVIGDGTETIEVFFSNQVLQNLIGFSYKEFSVKKKLKKYPEIEQELRTSLRNADQKIQTLDALVLLELSADKKPTVTKITDLTQEQKQILDKKVENFSLKNV
ncbi:recQ-mediated genome instability protein 1-like [Ceratina calcarata]|uniref:RecQ-mediated genome instability protein 1 n=1 Tax=Ceratina calcarata TaxID=156304 RepID=A0AAJ7JEL1_9HYME|nr:recQ-mediated genome instability protein 1-like [Ceratina calcarata]